MKLNGKQRKQLRALAHHLEPVVKVGKQGLTQSLAKAIATALNDHELIKVKFIDHKDEKRDIITAIEAQTGAHVAGLVGNIVILYKQSDIEEKRHIRL